jgi:hypothetical protein
MTSVQLGLFHPNTPLDGEIERLVLAREDESLNYTSSLNAAITVFHEYMRRQGFTDNTIKAFGGDLNMFARYLGPNKPVGEVSTREFGKFYELLALSARRPVQRQILSTAFDFAQSLFQFSV